MFSFFTFFSGDSERATPDFILSEFLASVFVGVPTCSSSPIRWTMSCFCHIDPFLWPWF
jgi:hypothetical protein